MKSYKNTAIPQPMQNTVNNCATGLGVIGVPGEIFAPGMDVFAIAPVWIAMTITLAAQSGHKLEQQKLRKIVMSVTTGAGIFFAGTKIASTVIGWILAIPTFGASVAVSAATNATLNYTLTKAYGRSAARYFLMESTITDSEVAAKIIIAFMGVDLGISTPYDSLIS